METKNPHRPKSRPGSLLKCVLHPLIQTSLGFARAPDVEKKKAEPRTPHFPGLSQDIIAWSQEGKWGLKYVIFDVGKPL